MCRALELPPRSNSFAFFIPLRRDFCMLNHAVICGSLRPTLFLESHDIQYSIVQNQLLCGLQLLEK